MVVESISMIIILTLIMFIFLREKRFEYAKTTAILLILPASYLLGVFLSYAFNIMFDVLRNNVVLLFSILGIIATCILIGLMAYHIKNGRLRCVYVLINGIFILIIGIVMIFDTINRTFITR